MIVNNEITSVITLIKSSLDCVYSPLPDDLDWDRVYRIVSAHQIAPLIYYGIRNADIAIPTEAMYKFRNSVLNSAVADEQQSQTLSSIFSAFENAGIDYMPLKGIVLKSLYPDTLTRVMGDADIMIHIEQYDKIKGIMTDFGFKQVVESDHELIWCKNEIRIELHKRLIPSYNKDYYSYYGDGWRLAKPCGDSAHRFCLDANDEFIYLFTHFSKHYRDGGIGIRHFVDLYVYINANKSLNESYISEELKKLQLYNFYLNIRRTIDVWFNGSESDDITDFITFHIFESGSYGMQDSIILASAVKESKNHRSFYTTRLYQIIEIIFPKYRAMSKRYTVLKKSPYLLPLFWIVRFFDTLLTKRKNIGVQRGKVQLQTPENIMKYQSELHCVGLDFNFTR